MSVAETAFGVALGGAAALIGAGYGAEALRMPLTDADRAAAPGRIVDLPLGPVHVRDWGAAEARPVILVHGLSTPSDVWAPIATRLAGAGIRTLAPDLYGRGWSARPARVHDARLYRRQIRDLLDAEGIDRPRALVGYSMGGAVVADFADALTDRAAPLALLAPAGFIHALAGQYAAMRVPLFGDAFWSLRAGAMLKAGALAEGKDHDLPDLLQIISRETARRGYLPAQLSALRNLLAKPLTAAHTRLGARGHDVLAVWGEDDDVIPISGMGKLTDANPNARQEVVKMASHGLAYTHADEVAAILIDWMPPA
ncbi:MAG: alpha/beta fold hydrolase [Pseudomonadota bacterium]